MGRIASSLALLIRGNVLRSKYTSTVGQKSAYRKEQLFCVEMNVKSTWVLMHIVRKDGEIFGMPWSSNIASVVCHAHLETHL